MGGAAQRVERVISYCLPWCWVYKQPFESCSTWFRLWLGPLGLLSWEVSRRGPVLQPHLAHIAGPASSGW